ncbi:MAG: hypothetical protein CMB80_03235 [Flammeovirgaceae bacterium]|nr:hypothetical protein [Flammeovirgaceae bacterium]
MASTVVASTLTTTITESITLNGVDQGGSIVSTTASIGEVLKHIVSVTDTLTELMSFGALAGKGQTVVSGTQYIRLTNLDDSYNAVINVINSSDDEVHFVLKPGKSFILSNVSSAMEANSAGAVASPTYADISTIKGLSASAGEVVDIECFICQT